MPLRPNLIEDLLSILNYSPRELPARAPMRGATTAGPQVDMEDLARRLSARAPSPRAAEASNVGESAVRNALAPVAPAAPQNAMGQTLPTGPGGWPAGTEAFATPAPPAAPRPLSEPQRFSGQALTDLRAEIQQLLGGQPGGGGSKVRAAPIPASAAPGVQGTPVTAAPQVPRADIEAVARGGTPPTTPQGSSFPPDVLRRAFSGPNGGTDGSWLSTAQRRTLARAHAGSFNDLELVQLRLNEAGLPITADQMQRRLGQVTRAQANAPQGTPLTPSRAAQAQTARTAPATRPTGYAQPAVQNWVQRFGQGHTPESFNRRYFAGLLERPELYTTDEGRTLHLSGLLRAPQGGLTLTRRDGSTVQVPAGTPLGSITRTIEAGQRSAYNNLFALNPQFQGFNIAKSILRGQVELYRRMGIEKVRVSAGLDGGGHTWARFGFVPSASGWQTLQTALLHRLGGIDGLDPSYRAAVRRLIQSDDPTAIRRVARLSMTPGANAGGGSQLGQRLLRGTGWSGTLDLTDAETMRHFDDYVRDAPTLGGPAWQ